MRNGVSLILILAQVMMPLTARGDGLSKDGAAIYARMQDDAKKHFARMRGEDADEGKLREYEKALNHEIESLPARIAAAEMRYNSARQVTGWTEKKQADGLAQHTVLLAEKLKKIDESFKKLSNVEGGHPYRQSSNEAQIEELKKSREEAVREVQDLTFDLAVFQQKNEFTESERLILKSGVIVGMSTTLYPMIIMMVEWCSILGGRQIDLVTTYLPRDPLVSILGLPVLAVATMVLSGAMNDRYGKSFDAKMKEFEASLRRQLSKPRREKAYWDAIQTHAAAAGLAMHEIEAALAPYICLKKRGATKVRVGVVESEPAVGPRIDSSIPSEHVESSGRVRVKAEGEPEWVGELGKEPHIEAPLQRARMKP